MATVSRQGHHTAVNRFVLTVSLVALRAGVYDIIVWLTDVQNNFYLLPSVKFQGGDADVFNLIFTGTKQQVPMRS